MGSAKVFGVAVEVLMLDCNVNVDAYCEAVETDERLLSEFPIHNKG